MSNTYNDLILKINDIIEEAYQQGLEDAWEYARKINGYDMNTVEIIFNKGNCVIGDVLHNYSAQEAMQKLQKYEMEPFYASCNDCIHRIVCNSDKKYICDNYETKNARYNIKEQKYNTYKKIKDKYDEYSLGYDDYKEQQTEKNCNTCKHSYKPYSEEPCRHCYDDVEKWENKEQQTGKWIEHEHESGDNWEFSKYECSQCHVWSNDDSDFCPNCGVDMRKESK